MRGSPGPDAARKQSLGEELGRDEAVVLVHGEGDEARQDGRHLPGDLLGLGVAPRVLVLVREAQGRRRPISSMPGHEPVEVEEADGAVEEDRGAAPPRACAPRRRRWRGRCRPRCAGAPRRRSLDEDAALDVHRACGARSRSGGESREGEHGYLDGLGQVAQVVDIAEIGEADAALVQARARSGQDAKALAVAAGQGEGRIGQALRAVEDALGPAPPRSACRRRSSAGLPSSTGAPSRPSSRRGERGRDGRDIGRRPRRSSGVVGDARHLEEGHEGDRLRAFSDPRAASRGGRGDEARAHLEDEEARARGAVGLDVGGRQALGPSCTGGRGARRRARGRRRPLRRRRGSSSSPHNSSRSRR